MTPAIWFDKFLAITLPHPPRSERVQQGLILLLVVALGLLISWLPPLHFLALLGGGAGLLLLLRYPALSLFILIPLIPFSSFVARSVGGVRVGLMEITLFLGLAGWLLHRLTHRQQSQSQRPSTPRLLWPFLLLLGSLGLSWLTTFSIAASLAETAKWVEMLLLYLLVTSLFSPRHIKWIIIAILGAGIAQAGLGIYQFVFKVGPPGFLLFGGRFLRAYGSFAQPNPYAGYLGLSLPLALALVLWSGRQLLNFSKKSKFREGQLKILSFIFCSLSFTILLVALFASQSRGAWVAFVIATTATIVVGAKKPGLILAGGVGLGLIVGLIGTIDWSFNQLGDSPDNNSAAAIVTQRLVEATTIITLDDIAAIQVTDANFSTLERLAHWQAAREMWRDNPWLGVGFGNYATIYPAYAVGRWLDPLGHAHNYLLNIGAEAGLVGIMGYLIFWILVFEVTWSVARKNHGFYRAVTAGCFGILVHLHVHNLFDNLYVNGMYLHIAIILALVTIILQTHLPGQNVRRLNCD